MTWTQPTNNGASISEYLIEWNQGSVVNSWENLVELLGESNDSYLKTGLTTGLEYTFRITATNVIDSSTVSSEVPIYAASKPDTMNTLTTVNSGTDVVTSWTAPDNGG